MTFVCLCLDSCGLSVIVEKAVLRPYMKKFNSVELEYIKIATILSVPFCPYHFVQYHFSGHRLSLSFILVYLQVPYQAGEAYITLTTVVAIGTSCNAKGEMTCDLRTQIPCVV